MSTIKADALTTKSDDTDLVVTAHGAGKVDIETAFKISGTAGVPVADLRTSSGSASSSTFLRGDGTWNAPSGGPDQASQAEMEGETNVDKYVAPDLLKYGLSICKIWAYVSRGGGTPTLGGPSYNVTSVTDDGDSQTIITIATDFSSVTYSPAAVMVADSTSFAFVHTLAVGSFKVKVSNDSGGSEDTRDFACQAFGDQA